MQTTTTRCIITLLLVVLCLATAPSYAQTPATTLDYARYIGAAGSDNQAVAIALNPMKELVVAVNIGTSGEIRRYSNNGSTLIHTTSVGGTIHDMDINRTTGEIAIVGSMGLQVYDPTATTANPTRSKTLDDGTKRVAISTDGRIVAAVGDTVLLWAADGTETSRATTTDMTGKSDRHIFDVAISTAHNHIYVGGYRQASANYQSPFLYAFQDNLTNRVWHTYDYWQSLVDAAQPYSLGADSRLYRIEIGRDGGLYILGKADGGTTVFKTDGTTPASQNGADLSYLPPVEIDNWNKTHNLKGGWKAFFGKVNAQTGVVERGQFLVPRWADDNNVPGAGSSSRSYEIANGALAVDEQGNVYVGGAAGKYIKGRFENTLTINGQPVGAIIPDDVAQEQGISNNEMTIYGVDATFAQRSIWTVFSKEQSNGSITGIAAGDGVVAFVGTSSYGTLFTTVTGDGATPRNGSDSTHNDAYFAILKAGEPAPSLEPPMVADIPDQRIVVGGSFTSITLDDYVKDPDGEAQAITWSYTGTQVLSVTLAHSNTHWVATIGLPDEPNWTGQETITFTATDQDNLSASDNATFTVTSNQPPVARDDSTITTRHRPVTIDVLANDYDLDTAINADSIVVATTTITTTPDDPYAPGEQVVPPDPNNPHGLPSGVVTIGQGTLTFSPTGTFTGTRTFTYTVRDQDPAIMARIMGMPTLFKNHAPLSAWSNEALVTVVIREDEHDASILTETAPYTTTVGEPLTLFVKHEVSSPDPDDPPKVVHAPAHGTVALATTDTFVYHPHESYTGTDSLVYMVRDTDGVLWYITVQVTIEQRAVNDDDVGKVYLPIVTR